MTYTQVIYANKSFKILARKGEPLGMEIMFNPFFRPSQQHRDTQETLAVLERLDLDTEKPTEEELARKFGYEDAYVKGKVNWWHHLQPKLWSLMDEPYSSNAAKVSKNRFLIKSKTLSLRLSKDQIILHRLIRL